MTDITELQIKISFLEESLEAINEEVSSQALALAQLRKENEKMTSRLKRMESTLSDGIDSDENMAHERPPHY